MIKKIHIQGANYFPGTKARLLGKSVIVRLKFETDSSDASLLFDRLHTAANALLPGDPLWGVDTRFWPNGFSLVAPRGETLGTWMVAIIVALQRWAREAVWQGRVIHEEGDQIVLALPWQRIPVFQKALHLGLSWLLQNINPNTQQDVLNDWQNSLTKWLAEIHPSSLSPNTMRFALAAYARKIPVFVHSGFIQLGWGFHARRLDSSFTDETSLLGTNLAKDKFRCSQVMHAACLPVPVAGYIQEWAQAQKLAHDFGWPVVIKPSNLDQGVGVVPGIKNEDSLQSAFNTAIQLSPAGVIIERHINGADHRLLVVGGKMRIATRRTAGGVTGDGLATVDQLISLVNTDPLRGTDKRSLLIRLTLDDEALSCLAEQGLDAQSVPELGRFVPLRRTANISTGGTAEDVTAYVHPDNRLVAERAARIVNLDIAGVDFLCPDITRSWREVGGAICEVNAQPGFRVHWLGDMKRDLNGEVLDWMFEGKSSRIPTIAITGTNGKTTVARMLHRILMATGKVVGVNTSQGVWIGDELVTAGNLSGNGGSRILLNDSSVEIAILEMPRKGLITLGHPCDHYDVAALLNVQNDHIGTDGINSMEMMAHLKAEILEMATQAIVVNADDPLCLAMRKRASCRRHLLVAQDEHNLAVAEHRLHGGEAVFLQDHEGARWIVLAKGTATERLLPLVHIPATMGGLLRFNEQNALFATALAWAQNIPTETIRAALCTFDNSVEQNTGRYNFINGFPFQILLDFGHNPDGVIEICNVVEKIAVGGKRRLANFNLGNRHKQHTLELAPKLVEVFGHFTLGCRKQLVEKNPEYAGSDPIRIMLENFKSNLLSSGASEHQITSEPDSEKAIFMALENAQPDDLLVILAESHVALPIIEAYRSRLQK